MPYPRLIIETERLIIRPFREEDFEPAYRMNLDVEVTKYTGDGGVVSREETERRIREDVFTDYEKHGFGRLAVELKAENKFIGFTGLKYLEDMKEVDLGYRFMKDYWGMGIATESAKASVKFGFQKLGLDKIIAMTLPENTNSIHILDKLQFKFERHFMEDGYKLNLYALDKNTSNKTHD